MRCTVECILKVVVEEVKRRQSDEEARMASYIRGGSKESHVHTPEAGGPPGYACCERLSHQFTS
jgi:hypothetical protein